MVEVNIEYEGSLRCNATHGPSGARINTDAPKDNMGKGEAFSPTDLVATALGTCMLTLMGITAQKHGIDLAGAKAKVTKEMVAQPMRRIGKLTVELHAPKVSNEEDQRRLQASAMTCPVHKSLHPDVQIPVTFHWANGKVTTGSGH